MKKIILFIMFMGISLITFAQTPAKMSYQAVIRDGDGKLVTNSQVGVQISVLRGTASGATIYAERQSPKANANGLVSFVIGEGNIVSGNFSNIDWEQGPYFIKTSTDPTGGANYTITGTTPLLSVPYALHAKSAETMSGTIDASQITNLGDLSGGGVDGTESVFTNWDKDATDDFSGAYQDLANKPRLFSGNYEDLSGRPQLYDRDQVDSLVAATGSEGIVQSLELNNGELSITGGNSVSFENWDTDGRDDFDGKYSSLTETPKIYTQAEVDSIKQEILQSIAGTYMKKSQVNTVSSPRDLIADDIGNTIACTASTTLTINAGFSTMNIGDAVNLEVHGTILTIKGSGVTINGVDSGEASIGNDQAYTGGVLRKTGANAYIVL